MNWNLGALWRQALTVRPQISTLALVSLFSCHCCLHLTIIGGAMSPSPDESRAHATAAPFQILATAANDPSSTGIARWLVQKPRDESWSPLTNLHSNHPTTCNTTATGTADSNSNSNADGAGTKSGSLTRALAQTQKKQ